MFLILGPDRGVKVGLRIGREVGPVGPSLPAGLLIQSAKEPGMTLIEQELRFEDNKPFDNEDREGTILRDVNVCKNN